MFMSSSAFPLILHMNMEKGDSSPYPSHGSRDHQQAKERDANTVAWWQCRVCVEVGCFVSFNRFTQVIT